MKGYPTWFTAKLIHVIILGLFISGLLLVPTTLVSQLSWQNLWHLSPSSRISATLIHVLFGFLVVFLLGTLWSIHMRYWWRRRQGRVTGVLLLTTFAFLILSGVGILYFGIEALVSFAAVSHALVGVLFVLPYFGHVLKWSDK